MLDGDNNNNNNNNINGVSGVTVCIEEVIDVQAHVLSVAIAAQSELPRRCLLLETVAGYQCSRYRELNLSGSSECRENRSNSPTASVQ